MKNEKQLPFFVYGTLRKGFVNYNRILKGMTAAEHAAITTGTMFSVGGFPALIESPVSESPIMGELMYIKPERYAEALGSMDYLEGYREGDEARSMYIRKKVNVFNESAGQMVECWVYYWNRSVSNLQLIESGCWREFKGVQ